jgi:Na+-transporting NADH:ubiquinone oxidoreductase subunit C
LCAEINQYLFEDQYIGKTIFDENNNFVSVKAVKGGAKPGDMHGVDGISGGTITSDGVTNMVSERLEHYLPYFKNK